MAAEAGWYPDPMGDTTKLRYWDGAAWTDHYAPAQGQPAATTAAAAAQPTTAANAQPASDHHAATADAQPAAAAAQPAADATQAATTAGAAQAPQPTVTVNVQQSAPAGTTVPVVYTMTDTDRTLRLIAFILNLITIAGCCWLIIPLAWMIPMTVRTWGIYKGTKPNTVALGVCTLIFVNIVSGILLLCSKKEA